MSTALSIERNLAPVAFPFVPNQDDHEYDPWPIQLAALADRINAAHNAAESAARSTVEHAANAGRLLIEVKDLLWHGEFLPWLEKNTKVSPRQSQRYMKLAKNWPAIEGKYDAASHLTIDGALRLLAPTEKPKPHVANNTCSDSSVRDAVDGRTMNAEIIGKVKKPVWQRGFALCPVCRDGKAIDGKGMCRRCLKERPPLCSGCEVRDAVDGADDPAPGVKGKGISLAHDAIAILKRIPPQDTFRQRAASIVMDYLKANF